MLANQTRTCSAVRSYLFELMNNLFKLARERETDRDRERETERERKRETEREKQRERNRETEKDKEREREG